MGKEAFGTNWSTRRAIAPVRQSFLANMRGDWKKAWNTRESVVLKSQLVEDGRVIVNIIKSSRLQVTMVCMGLANEGNRYTKLLGTLKRQGHLARWDRVLTVAILQDLTWSPIDHRHARFNSGDHVLLTLAPSSRLKRRLPIRTPTPTTFLANNINFRPSYTLTPVS